MNNKIFIFLLLLLVAACDKESKSNLSTNSAEKPSTQAIIVIKNSTDSPISIELLDSVAHRSDNWVVTYKSVDTISLKLNHSARVTIHSLIDYRQTRFISRGDTLRIDLNSSEMTVKSTDRLDAQKIVEGRRGVLSETDSLYNLLVSVDSSLAFKGVDYDLSVVKRYAVTVNKPLNENHPEIYDQLVENLIYQLDALPASLTELNNPELEAIQNLKLEIDRHEAQLRLMFLARQFDRPEIYDKIFASKLYRTDLFTKSPFARSYLSFLINQLVLKGEEDRSSNRSYVNYKLAYDRLPKYLDGELLKTAREICLEMMVSYGESQIILNRYIAEFLTEHRDSTFVNSFRDRYLFSFPSKENTTTDLAIVSNSDTIYTLSEVIQNDMDSVLFYYVDFWASWCAPCIKAMPASEVKRKFYQDKGVKFIYLSMDNDKEKWRNASFSHHLETYENSYLLINAGEQQFIKDLKIDFIPRYVILNSNGEVIESNAPGPEGGLFDEVIGSYLKN